MGNVYIFRGKAATGKTTLSDMLAKKLSVPVFRKDDIVDALKMSGDDNKDIIRNDVCYNILYKMLQTNLDLNVDFIMDIALGDKNNAKMFYDRLNFGGNKIISFFIDCTDTGEWEKRHAERLNNPKPHQSFKSIAHAVEHYKKFDISPMDGDYVIDTAGNTAEESFELIVNIVNGGGKV